MASARKIQPPFAWLGRFWVPVGVAAVVIVAAYFRFYELSSLPPGLDETSARIGLEGLRLGASHWLPTLDTVNGYAPLWVWLQSLSVHVFGHTILALRVWPALLGTLAVAVSWLWIRDWLGKRTAWVTAFLLAVSPWAVGLSRNGIESALLPLLVPLTLWLAGRAFRSPGTWQYTALGAVLALDLLSGPIGWILAVVTLALGARKLATEHKLVAFTNQRAGGVAALAVGAATLGYFLGSSLPALRAMPEALHLTSSLATIGHNLVKVLLMFNVHGDENYRHNLAGEPLLNAFVGIMMVAGLLVSISRLNQRRYRALLILPIALLLPAIVAPLGAPNSSWAVGALPLVLALAGIGTSYMLDLWYTTFPINSAARATGQAAVILLMALSGLQGYTQYFAAYAGSTAVYLAYNEGPTQIGLHLITDKTTGDRYVVMPLEQAPVVDYLYYGHGNYRVISISQLEALPIAAANRQFYIAASVRDDAVKILKAKFPGGVLLPHISGFNLVEIYYTYEVKK